LPIIAYRTRNPCLAAIAATYDLPPGDNSLAAMKAAVNFRRGQFLTRAYELAKHDKYFLVRGIITNPHYFDAKRAIGAFELCARCCPTVMIYPPAFQKRRKFKSCGHSNFCPSCWCAVAMRQYQQLRLVLNAFMRQGALGRICVTPYITEQFVPAPNISPNAHASAEAAAEALDILQSELGRYRNLIQLRRRQINRTTVSAYWRLVPIPAEGGWRIQFRQLFLTLPEKQPPVERIKYTRILTNKTLLLSGGKNWQERWLDETENKLDELMLDFLRYPADLLTEDIDLAAAVLNATAKQRMVGGYGKFRSAGSGLLKKMREQDEERQAQNDGKKRA
jgi:pyruvate/2-oxoacid:ferredoxin oxidoreductase beta subunit